MESDRLMAQILDACERVGGEVVLRELEDAGLIEMTGVDESGAVTFALVRREASHE